jgi:spore maturation protein CgeB
MNLVFFVHSAASDWNHGNAHFVRGLMDALHRRGHRVTAAEPAGAWSLINLAEEAGASPVVRFAREFPGIEVETYHLQRGLEERLSELVSGADVVVVHEWTDPVVVGLLALERRRRDDLVLLFHDTHHRAVSQRPAMAALNLGPYDGVLAFGDSLRQVYERELGVRRAWTFHEAADVRRFRPLEREKRDDVVWIGNWGDDERSEELATFLLEPVRALRLTARAHGVRYPEAAERALARAGMASGGYLPNFRVPDVFARFALTVHVPRRPYVEALPGIPTIRPFEALACGIPLVCSPWDDVEGLFTPGRDYLVARDGAAMRACLRAVLHDDELARDLAQHGHETILARHTCAHRVDELMAIAVDLGCGGAAGLGALAEPADARGVPHDREVLRP